MECSGGRSNQVCSAQGSVHGLALVFTAYFLQCAPQIERTTNHDVKAVEYVLKRHFAEDPELSKARGLTC